MTAEAADRWAINAGRERPKYQPKQIKCPGCGAGQSVKDEASQLVVCDYCGSHLDTTEEEATVLGKGPDQKWEFPIKLGESFRHKGQRYEVSARLALIEDGDTSELTRQYLLYNPRRGTMWLSEYKGNYDLTESTHVMPVDEPLAMGRGDVLKTHDGREWVMQEAGEYELAYVDGALPWQAKVGERQRYAEFTAKDGSGDWYEVESRENEVEYAIGRRMPFAAVNRALGRADITPPAAALGDAAETRSKHRTRIAVAAIALLVNLVLGVACMTKGSKVLDESFTPEQLTAETLSKPFRVAKDNNVVKIKYRAGVSNAWMALNVGFVEGDDNLIHVEEEDISYYHGSEGGESWSEGSRKRTSYVKVPTAGTYHLLVQAVSASGDASQAESCQHGLRVRVYDGAARPNFFFTMAVFSFICMVVAAARYGKWKNEEE